MADEVVVGGVVDGHGAAMKGSFSFSRSLYFTTRYVELKIYMYLKWDLVK